MLNEAGKRKHAGDASVVRGHHQRTELRRAAEAAEESPGCVHRVRAGSGDDEVGEFGGGRRRNIGQEGPQRIMALGGCRRRGGGFVPPAFLRPALVIRVFFLSSAGGGGSLSPPPVSRSSGGSSSTPNWTLGVLVFSSVVFDNVALNLAPNMTRVMRDIFTNASSRLFRLTL